MRSTRAPHRFFRDKFYEDEPLVYYAARKGYLRLARYLARWREIPKDSPSDELAIRRMLRPTEQYQAELRELESPDRDLLEQYPEFDMEDHLLVRRIGIIGAGIEYPSRKIDGHGPSLVRELEMGIWNPFEGNIWAIQELFDRHGLPWNCSCGLARVARFEDLLFGGRFADFVSRPLYLAGRFSSCHSEREEFDDEWERPEEPEWL